MKRLTQISLTAISLLLLNGCNPALMNNQQLDPSLPKLQNVKAVPGNTMVAFEWQPMAEKHIDGYNIYRTGTNQYVNSPTKEVVKIAAVSNPFSAHYVDENLQQNAVYTYTFTTVRGGFESAPGKIVSVKTLPPFEPVTFFQGFQKARNTVKLIWRPHSDLRVEKYRIERSFNHGKWQYLATVKNRMMAEYIDSRIKPGYVYAYRIIAIGFDGSSSRLSKIVSIQTR